MRNFILTFLLLGFVVSVNAQVTTATYNTPFYTDNQSLWQSGSSGIIEINHELFGFDWNEGGTYGDITSIAGQEFGVEVTAGTWGNIGSGLTINFGTEKINVGYNTNMNIDFPTIHSFNAGGEIILNTDWQPLNSGSYLMPSAYDMNIGLWMRMGMGVNLGANLCAFSCADMDFLDLNMSTRTFDLVELSSANGLSLLDGLVNVPASADYPLGFFPLEYSDPTGIISLELDLPHNTAGESATYFSGINLHYNSTYRYFNMHLSIPAMIAAMHIPYVSAVFGNLSNSWSAGPFYLDYTVMESGFDLGLYNNQMLEFEPEMHGKLDFPALVDYEVVNPLTGAVVETGNDSVINYLPGQEIRIDFPCQYDFMDVIPSYSISNEFTNHTYDSIAFDFLFDMLAFNVGVEPLTVIPEICIPIYKPCGPWYCPVCDWCHDGDICTPAVGFDGFDFGFGPLVHWQPNLYNTSYDWVDNTWELDGFNSFEDLNAIRLEPSKFNVTSTHNDVLCHGEASGDASAYVSNGNPPYLYEWDNGESQFSHQTIQFVDELLAGTHYVSVTDANGCMVFTSFVVDEPIAPLSVNVDLSNPTCNGFSNGEIDLVVEGGTSAYSYVWSNGETTNNISGLTAGEYTITVTDANACSIIESFVLTEPEELQIEIIKEDVNCSGGNSGSLQAIVSGGMSPYTYVWNNGETESQIQNLSAGTYNLTATDFNGCTLTEAFDVLEPSEPLAVSSTVIDVLCNGDASGSIILEITGGTQPYVCNWYNSENIWLNETSGVLTDLMAGDYSVNVTDANGCSEFLEINISEPNAFEYSATLTNVLCYGESTGVIELDLSGATAPYSYEWSNGETSEDIDEIAAGLYTLTITDSNACVYELQEEIIQPDEPLVSEIVVKDVLCYGEKTGAISVETQGGTIPYTYLWNNSVTESLQNNIEAGVYTVTVTDGNGCQHYTGGEVKQPEAPLSLESVVVDASCFGSSNGQVELSINGGTLPYRVVWDDDEYLINNNLHSLSNLESGQYQVSILDFNNCNINGEFVINQPQDVSISFETGIVSCFGGEDGFANSSITGGTSPYTYQWSDGQNEANLINVSAGEYVLSIVDALDCQYSAEVDIESMSEIEIAYEIKNKTCIDVDDASIYVFVSGGTEEYVYLWSNGAVSQNINDLAAGNYSLTVTDGNYCEQFVDVFIPESTNECLNIPSTFTPNGDGINDTWILRNIFAYPDASIQVYTQTGQFVFESNGAYQPWDGNYNGEQLPAAVYYYIVNLNDGTDSFTGTVTILR